MPEVSKLILNFNLFLLDSRFQIRDCGNFLRKLPRIENSFGIFKVPVNLGRVERRGWANSDPESQISNPTYILTFKLFPQRNS
jgi:hypothetical protein